nr:rna polymerase ii c-terminal domain phosphatase-like 4 [Quercus suber]
MKIISERGFPQDDYDDFDDTPEESTEKTCLHPCVFRGKCVSCETVALKYVHQSMWLWLNKDEMDRIRKIESEKLLEDKKMVLVLDLDQTLIHSTEQEKYLRTPQELLQHELRDSLFHHDLSVVSLSALGTDEGETTGALTTVLQQLKLIHRLFFNPKFEGGLQVRDVRDILNRLRVLQGCTLFFKHIFPSDFRPENSRLWLMAEELGAKISMDNLINPVTHVVTWFATAEEFEEAEMEEIILVHPKWLHACYKALERVSEKDYLIKPKD